VVTVKCIQTYDLALDSDQDNQSNIADSVSLEKGVSFKYPALYYEVFYHIIAFGKYHVMKLFPIGKC
jgi:hypothetical protein